MRTFFLIFFSLVVSLSKAQDNADYKVERDSVDRFFLLQGGRRTPFDTTQLRLSLQKKQGEQEALQAEINLLERIVILRRQVQVNKDESSTLLDIIDKARSAAVLNSKKSKGK